MKNPREEQMKEADILSALNRMNKTAKNTKDTKEFTADFSLPWRLGGSIC
jgi:hypothetical protein